MSKKLVTLSAILALALVLGSGGYLSAQAAGESSSASMTKTDKDKWREEPMKYYSHSAATDGTDYGRPIVNLYGPDQAKNSAAAR